MFDTFLDLPLHVLVIHAVVVLGPLAALLLVVYAAVPRWRVGLQWPTLLLAAIAAGSAFVATQSGEFLRDTKYPQQVPPPVTTHEEAGDLAAISLYVLLGVAVVVVLLLGARAGTRATSSKGAGVAGLVLAVAAAGFATYAVIDAGHSGSTAVWGGVVPQ